MRIPRVLLAASIAIAASAAAQAQDKSKGTADVSPAELKAKTDYCKTCHGLSGQGFRGAYPMPRLAGQQPAEADIQRHFRVSPPSVHQMIVTLERNGFIRRQPGIPRSIEILLPPENLPILEWLGIKTSKSLR